MYAAEKSDKMMAISPKERVDSSPIWGTVFAEKSVCRLGGDCQDRAGLTIDSATVI